MNFIKINHLSVETQIGCNHWEQQVKQTLIVDIEYSCDFSPIAATDDIKNAICYSSVADHILTFAEQTQVRLLETWIHRLADSLMQTFKIPQLKLVVQKRGHLAHAQSVSMELLRTA